MPKYDSLRKLERNRELKLFKEVHPDLSLKEIGKYFSVLKGGNPKPLSAQRVWKILKNSQGAEK